MTAALQKEYEKKCKERGLVPTNLKRKRSTFSTLDHAVGNDNMPQNKKTKIEVAPPKADVQDEAVMVLVKRSLLKEIIDELRALKETMRIETREELEKL